MPSVTAMDVIWKRGQLADGFVAPRSADPAAAAAGLARMRRLAEALGSPQRAYETVHIAGSKGKSSTAAFVASLLTETGKRTGRYTSPHLTSWRERIAVDGVPISAADFDRVTADVDTMMTTLEAVLPDQPPHNAFELLTAVAFVHFAQSGCQAAVLEVGIGGRFDSTNVIESKVAVITHIEGEHLELLGPTLADVAWNKAGIMRAGRPCVTVRQDPIVLAKLREVAAATGATLLEQGRDWSFSGSPSSFSVMTPHGWAADLAISSPMAVQVGNAATAVMATSLLSDRELGSSAAARRELVEGLRTAELPGRFEAFHHDGPVLLDVAHTAHSIAALGVSVRAVAPGRPVTVLVGILADKDAEEIARAMASWGTCVVVTTPPSPRALPSERLAAAMTARRLVVHHAPDVDEAWRAALSRRGTDGVVVVTGSFALVAHIRRLLLEEGSGGREGGPTTQGPNPDARR